MFNLFIVLILTFVVALILIFFISSHDRKLKKKQEQLLISNELEEEESPLDFRQFSKVCMDICENLKLEIDDVTQLENDEIVVRAHSSNPITNVSFLVVCFHLHKKQTLDNSKVMEISDQIISERLSKGIIMTTGLIDPAVKNLPELAPMEFIDGNKLKELIEEYKINY